MRKLRDLYLLLVLLFLSFSGTQASEKFSYADFSNKIEINIHSISVPAATSQDISSPTSRFGMIPEISSVLSHRLRYASPKAKNWKSLFRYRSLSIHSALQLAAYQTDKFQQDILSERHSNGFHLYFLKKIIV